MARKKTVKLYKENELQNEVVFNINANGNYTATLANNKVAVKKITVNTNIAKDNILTVQRATGSYGDSDDTYLSLHKPTSADDYILSSKNGSFTTECDSVVLKGVNQVYIWGNGYAIDEYNLDNFTSLKNNATYDLAVAVELTAVDNNIYLEHYYSGSSGSGGMHSSGS